jgi:hypothetical protein
VALVYSPLNVQDFDLRSFLRGTGRIVSHIFTYLTWSGLLRFGYEDLRAIIQHHAPDPKNPRPSLRVSRDRLKQGITALVPLRPVDQQRDPASGLLVLIKQLADDFLAYVYRKGVRDGIVDFVQEALVQLADRVEVGAIVVNSHSQGSAAVFDALSDLDQDQPKEKTATVTDKVVWLMTEGSPLRKYVEFFGWSNTLRNFAGEWTNFYDPHDPAADPFEPSRRWRLGMPVERRPGEPELFQRANRTSLEILDIPVDNVDRSSGGGLRAHNYWDNEEDFVIPVARALKIVAGVPQ